MLKSILYIVSGILFGLFVAALIWVSARAPSGQSVTLRPVPTEAPIVVQIAGAVPRPGVYALPRGARVQDAVSAAGGFPAEANKGKVNLARRVEDGERIEIPFGEDASLVIPTDEVDTANTSNADLVNINTASLFELDALPGIGPALAQRIIDYREENGDFLDITEIMDVSGIGPALFERLEDLITVDE
ncbi:MAG TPA: helix-hairpin-helix domain-containing protein [Anaerolineales bacterium]|nr:helix-hairpin-helix domain-containing protein [Anaerolineales bacterium]